MLPRTLQASRLSRAAHKCAELDQGLREFSGKRLRGQFRPDRLQLSRRPAHRNGDGEDPREYAGYVAVHGHRRDAECQGCNGGGGVGPDPGQRLQLPNSPREASVPFRNDDLRGAVEIPRPAVVAEARPGVENFPLLGPSQCTNRRPSVEEGPVARHDRGSLGLLQHDFTQPDAVRVALAAPWAPPREITPMPLEPREQVVRVGP